MPPKRKASHLQREPKTGKKERKEEKALEIGGDKDGDEDGDEERESETSDDIEVEDQEEDQEDLEDPDKICWYLVHGTKTKKSLFSETETPGTDFLYLVPVNLQTGVGLHLLAKNKEVDADTKKYVHWIDGQPPLWKKYEIQDETWDMPGKGKGKTRFVHVVCK